MENLITILKTPVILFVLQLTIILALSRILGSAFKKAGQPFVMGEIVAGIALGPSLFGHILPVLSNYIFPISSLGILQVFSQIGLIAFMFIVGLELDFPIIAQKVGSALVISYTSIIVPFGMGIALSYFLYKTFTPHNASFFVFAMFIGISMSITAFPVLARIIRDKGMSDTRLGNTAITCAAIDDITGWCLLAIIISMSKGSSFISSLGILLSAIIYLSVMLFAIRPFLRKALSRNKNIKHIDSSTLVLIFVILFLSACCSEIIGIHFLFGGFVFGLILPDKKQLRATLIEKIGDFTLVILLPLFFVNTGLRTQINLLNTPMYWIICGLIVLVAVLGKFGGSAISAGIMGESLKDSLSIGALMNTRGMVELIVLNIGYDMGILPPLLFTMMILMALFTTLMTTPLLNLIAKKVS